MKRIFRYITWMGVILILLAIGMSCSPTLTSEPAITQTDVPVSGPTNTDEAETILIPGGTFWMGSGDTDTQAGDDEIPRHQVTLASFYLYTHEVTNKMYAACVDAGACLPVNVMDSGPTTHTGDPAYDDYPIVGADWNMARDYCAWAGSRLPTEAEWEYAARGTESLLYPWGSENPACDRVNMLGCAVPPDTVEVGSYLLGNSPFAVWDMSGNVWEWTHDWYAEGYYVLSPATNPLGPYAPTDWNHPLKVARGGGLYSGPEQMRSADRAGVNPYRAYDDVGFRCVAVGESLPESYTETRDRHEMVPPDPLDGGGEHVEDPDDTPLRWFLHEYDAASSCPDPDGRIFIGVRIQATPGTEFMLMAGGVWFDCTYDETEIALRCEGPAPADYGTSDTLEVTVQVLPPYPGAPLLEFHYPVEKPTDCDRMSSDPWNVWFELFCDIPAGDWVPEGELVNVGIYTDIPIRWDDISSSGESLACWQILDTETHCLLPRDPARTEYPLNMHGWNLDRTIAYERFEVVSVSIECPGTPRGTNVEPFCFEGQPTVHVGFTPMGTVLESATSLGVPLSCIGMTPVDMYCGVLPGEAGMPSTVTTCFVGETCESWPINVPDCDPGTAHWFDTSVVSTCYGDLGPVAVIHYTPAEQPMVAANANGFDLTCYDTTEPGWYMCSGIPGAPGDPMTISFCLADGTCFSEPIIVSDCGTATWDADEWSLIAVACTEDETQISFMVDTYLDWLTPSAVFTYSATDGETTYSCSAHATVAGRIYCAGTRPESPGDLQLCLQRPGDAAPTCTTFPEYDIWVNATPPCQTITVTPPPPQTLHCSDYTDAPTCNSHWADGCKWGTTTCTGP